MKLVETNIKKLNFSGSNLVCGILSIFTTHVEDNKLDVFMMSPFKYFALFGCLFFVQINVYSVDKVDEANPNLHELTIYVMPTLFPLDWEGPASLYKSMKNVYVRTITKRDNYLLGHVSVRLSTTLLSKPLLIAQTSGSLKEKLDLVFRQRVGYAIIGAPLQGRIESPKEISHKLDVYAKRNKLAFIKYLLSEKAAKRIIDFIDNYSLKMNEHYAPSDFYGGAFWPRYYNEGAGCSTFAAALLDVVNLLEEEHTEDWEMRVKIPMHLIGGQYNNGLKVTGSAIRNTKDWYAGDGNINEDYVVYAVYEPSIMFDWIMEKRASPTEKYIPVEEGDVPGVVIDGRGVIFNKNEPFFKQRTEPNLFINHYLKKINISTIETL